MARQSNTDLLVRYRKRVTISQTWRRKEDYDGTWRRLIDMYKGKHYANLAPEDRMVVNISFATVNVVAPSVAVNYPKIAVNARRPEDAPRAIIVEAVINYWWKRFKVRPEFRRAVKDFLIVGHGWLKVGYRYVEEERIDSDDDASEVREVGEGGEALSDPSTPTIVVTEDRPFVERVSPFDIFVDPDATSEQDMAWIAQRVKRPLREVKSDRRYSATARNQASATSWNAYDEAIGSNEPVDRDEGYVEVWEFYDLKRKTLSVFCTGGDHFLVKPKPMPYSFGHPFIMIRNYDVPDDFYPMGDLEAIEPLQQELNETRSQMMNHRRKYARKYLYNEDAFDEDGRNALASDNDNELVPVKNGFSLQESLQPLPATITPPEFYNQSELISSDINNITAVSEYQRGGMPEIRRTATEAAIVQDASNARAADKLAIIEQAISAVAERLVQLAQQFMDGEDVARIVGKDGVPLWVNFDADYIAGEFDYDIESGSTAPVNESFRRQSALQMVDAMAPFIQLGVVDPSRLAAHLLQTGFGIKNPEQFLMGPLPEMGPGGEPAPGGVPGQETASPMGGDVVAPPPTTPSALGGIDPAILAQLASQVGLG